MDEKGLSVADALALSRNSNSDDTFGGNGAWWLIILILFFGMGRGLYGNNGNDSGSSSGGVTDGYVLSSDFANIERKIDGVDNGLCDGFYAQNTSLLNGFSGVNNNIATNAAAINSGISNGVASLSSAITSNGYETRNAVQQNMINAMQNTNSLSTQLASCCCDNRAAISDVNYNMATQANAIQTALAAQNAALQTQVATQSNAIQTLLNSNSNDIERQVENSFCNTNYNMATQNNTTLQAIDKVGDRIIDYLSNEKIQTLRDENQALRFAASQSAQNNYLVDQLRMPSPVPAFNVASPYYTSNTCGCM